ncbi:MAG: hypothetical protein FD174_1994 [Geobacteraceae bacterium]|nr:MAG: hypothetical protein FD174_1994 [Geobacteraceae bacterium]
MKRAVFCLLILIIAGCGGSEADRQAVTAVAVKRQQALNSKDIALYISLLSGDYQDKGKNLAAKKAELEATFNAFDRLDYRFSDPRVDIKGDRATISGDYVLRVTTKGKDLSLEGKEHILLKKEHGGWKIIGGL